jgi:hypothetical protein
MLHVYRDNITTSVTLSDTVMQNSANRMEYGKHNVWEYWTWERELICHVTCWACAGLPAKRSISRGLVSSPPGTGTKKDLVLASSGWSQQIWPGRGRSIGSGLIQIRTSAELGPYIVMFRICQFVREAEWGYLVSEKLLIKIIKNKWRIFMTLCVTIVRLLFFNILT